MTITITSPDPAPPPPATPIFSASWPRGADTVQFLAYTVPGETDEELRSRIVEGVLAAIDQYPPST